MDFIAGTPNPGSSEKAATDDLLGWEWPKCRIYDDVRVEAPVIFTEECSISDAKIKSLNLSMVRTHFSDR